MELFLSAQEGREGTREEHPCANTKWMPWDSELEVGGSHAGCACVGGVSKQQAASPTWNHFSML